MLNSPIKTEVENEENDVFFFESDHLAIKGNRDYSELLKTLFILQAQQIKAIKDYDTVAALQKKALEDPLEALEKLKTPEGLGIPELQTIPEVPEIDWTKYDVSVPEDELKLIKEGSIKDEEKYKHKKYSYEDESSNKDTHNKPWTTEEQKRLEELLVIHPPELIEIRRFKKIAAALGNRTTKQVCSRVQKYFLKLYKAGLPIPGRIPKSVAKYKKLQHRHHRFNHYLTKPTTFFPELDIPVVMNEADEVPGPSSECQVQHVANENYLIPNNNTYGKPAINETKSAHDVKQYQLDILKRVKQEKDRESKCADKPFCHIGFKCDYCSEEPISGIRWHCISCENASIDFCSDCVVAQMYTENCHPPSHRLITIRNDKVGTTSSISDSESCASSEQNYDSSEGSDAEAKTKNESQFYTEIKEPNQNAFNGGEESDGVLNDDNSFVEMDTEIADVEDYPYDYLHSIMLSNNGDELI